MKTSDSKMLLGLVAGIAIGAAVGYLIASDRGEELLCELKEVAGKAKEGLNSAIAKAKETGCEVLQSIKESKETVSEKAS
jgi:gas vesicle protein